jgi:chromosome segregation ATPase
MIDRLKSIGPAVAGLGIGAILIALFAWSLSSRSWAQPQQEPTLLDLRARISALEKENQQDYKALRDLYQRLQNLESRMNDQYAELGRRIQALSEENRLLRSQLEEYQENVRDRTRTMGGYPMVRSIQKDKSGNVIVDYAK